MNRLSSPCILVDGRVLLWSRGPFAFAARSHLKVAWRTAYKDASTPKCTAFRLSFERLCLSRQQNHWWSSHEHELLPSHWTALVAVFDGALLSCRLVLGGFVFRQSKFQKPFQGQAVILSAIQFAVPWVQDSLSSLTSGESELVSFFGGLWSWTFSCKAQFLSFSDFYGYLSSRLRAPKSCSGKTTPSALTSRSPFFRLQSSFWKFPFPFSTCLFTT